MVYAVSGALITFVSYFTEWLLCPEAVLIFVVSLALFNVFRLFRGIFLCFCRWKYRRDEKELAAEYRILAHDHDEKEALKKYCHEAKSCDMASFSLQGRRKTMEDRFSCIPHNLEDNSSIYAVFDGHGGEFAAEYVEEQLFHSIRKELSRGSFQSDTDSVKQVLTSLMRTIDAQLICIARDRMDLSGSTCVMACQIKDMLTVANVGDSRAVMCTGDGRAVPMSIDHKPSDPKEQKRITEAGGFVTFNGVWRVAGVLATSRAFGDYPLKQRKFVTVEPDFFTVDMSKMDPHFVILASDGLWDVFSNEEATNFIRGRLDEPHFGAKSLALQAYYRGSLDNITVMVINLRRKRVLQKKHDRHVNKQQDDKHTNKEQDDKHTNGYQEDKHTNKEQDDKLTNRYQDDKHTNKQQDDKLANRYQEVKHTNKQQEDKHTNNHQDDKLTNNHQDDKHANKQQDDKHTNKQQGDEERKKLEDISLPSRLTVKDVSLSPSLSKDNVLSGSDSLLESKLNESNVLLQS